MYFIEFSFLFKHHKTQPNLTIFSQQQNGNF
jgi:hypothetical protein